MSNICVTKEIAHEGMRVVRGRDWQWGEQDKGGPGTIVGMSPGYAKVEWDNNPKEGPFYYRTSSAHLDLYIYVPQGETKPPSGERILLTRENVQPGIKVKLREEGSAWSAGAKNHLTKGIVYTVNRVLNGAKADLVELEELKLAGGFCAHNFEIVEDVEKKVNRVRDAMEKVAQYCAVPEGYATAVDPYVDRGYGIYGKSLEKSKTNTNDRRTTDSYAGSTLKLPAKNLTLKRGERIEGRRLYS